MFDSLNEFLRQTVNNLSNNLGIWYYIILNAFGVIAIILKVCEPQQKNRKTILKLATIACFCWSFYFTLYGNFTSGISCLLSVPQLLVFSQREKHKWARSIAWLFVFIGLHICFGVLTFSVWHNIFPIIAGSFSVIAYFVIDGDKYRIFVFIYILFWVVNSAVNFFPIALLSDSFSTISAFVAIIRFNVLAKRKKNMDQTTEENSTLTNKAKN